MKRNIFIEKIQVVPVFLDGKPVSTPSVENGQIVGGIEGNQPSIKLRLTNSQLNNKLSLSIRLFQSDVDALGIEDTSDLVDKFVHQAFEFDGVIRFEGETVTYANGTSFVVSHPYFEVNEYVLLLPEVASVLRKKLVEYQMKNNSFDEIKMKVVEEEKSTKKA